MECLRCARRGAAGRRAGRLLKESRPRAEQGDAAAQAAVGDLYLGGEGVSQDAAEAARWYRLAAEQGDASGQYGLAYLHAVGQGVPLDEDESARLMRLAADQREVRAQYAVALLYANRLAADQGEPLAQYDLGVMYAQGTGVRQNDAKAYLWLSLAASRMVGDERDRAVRMRDEIGRRMPSGRRAAATRATVKPVFER